MSSEDSTFTRDLSRRELLAAASIAAVVRPLIGIAEAETLPGARQAAGPGATPPVAGLHLQFGGDASSEMVVSWHTLQPVSHPRVLLGRLDGRLEKTVE